VSEIPRHRIRYFGAVGLAGTVGLSLSLVRGVMVILAASAILAPAATPSIPGVTTKTVTVTVGSRSFPARLSYPTRGGPYPALAFGHGYTARASWYASTIDALARAGTVVIAPDSETGVAANHSRFADDLNRSLAWLASESRAGGTVVPRGKVDGSRTAVAGHSMGGGAALLAAARSRTVDTVATLAAFETSPSAAAAARRLQVASLFVVGSDDRIFPAMRTARMFRGAPSPSLLASITGGSHCGFQDKVPPACDARGRISYPRQRALTREQLRRWLERYLKGTPGAPVTGVQGISYTQR
jgi:dienelactone hydrolase